MCLSFISAMCLSVKINIHIQYWRVPTCISNGKYCLYCAIYYVCNYTMEQWNIVTATKIISHICEIIHCLGAIGFNQTINGHDSRAILLSMGTWHNKTHHASPHHQAKIRTIGNIRAVKQIYIDNDVTFSSCWIF